ncbi:hypothetical protein FKM82_021327, partial [Ascaphus truei]
MWSGESPYEMIELQMLEPCAGLDLTTSARGGHRLERTNAVRIPPGRAPPVLQRSVRRRILGERGDPPPAGRAGEGHFFQPTYHTQHAWCDLCGDFIWGIYKKSLRCMYCNFTCHYRCRALIRLDCSREVDEDSESDSSQEIAWEKDTNV